MVMLEVITQKRECLKPTQASAEAGQNTLILPGGLLQISIAFRYSAQFNFYLAIELDGRHCEVLLINCKKKVKSKI